MFINIDGKGEVEIKATMYTLHIYEKEFHSDLIKDVFGKHEVSKTDPDVLVIDYTQENWNEERKALWAMVKTAADLKDEAGDLAPNDRVPGYEKWVMGIGQINVRDIANAVFTEATEGFFHTGAAASE